MIDHKKLRETLARQLAVLQAQEQELRNKANNKMQEYSGVAFAIDELDKLIEKMPKLPSTSPFGNSVL